MGACERDQVVSLANPCYIQQYYDKYICSWVRLDSDISTIISANKSLTTTPKKGVKPNHPPP
jgi:hypothetical protein